MLAVSSPFLNDEREGPIDSFQMTEISDEFPDFSGDINLLESIDFNELFVGIEIDGDVLPDLDMDGGDFSVSGGEDLSKMNTFTFEKNEDDNASGSGSGSSVVQDEEIISKRGRESVTVATDSSRKGHEKRRKSKNHQGKRKVKVDWTPELHKRFVQAVEQLGVDKAVPSRILEVMGIDCLTRHNIASHLQKYRSHRKHLIARETEAASWSHRRQMYGGSNGGGINRDIINSSSYQSPAMGFPTMAPPPTMPRHFRPLHVWGHPHVDCSLPRVWPKHIAPSPPLAPPLLLPPSFAHHSPPPQVLDSSFWHAHHQFRFPTPPVQGIPPPHAMYKVDAGSGSPLTNTLAGDLLVDFQPSKESIDAAIGDVLSEPWQPLPLGLKPPSLDSVMVELNHQGIQNIPPTCTLTT